MRDSFNAVISQEAFLAGIKRRAENRSRDFPMPLFHPARNLDNAFKW
jgi:hypothetical protein